MSARPEVNKNFGSCQRSRAEDLDALLRSVTAEMISDSPLKRATLADLLSKELNMRVTARMLDDWLSPSKRLRRLPAILVAPICSILNDDRLARFVVGERLRRLIEYAELELAASHDERRRQLLRNELLKDKEAYQKLSNRQGLKLARSNSPAQPKREVPKP